MKSRGDLVAAAVIGGAVVLAACRGPSRIQQDEIAQTAHPIETGEPPSTQTSGIVSGKVVMGRGAISRETAHEPRGIAGREVKLLDASGGAEAGKATTDADGSFRISAPPGTYMLKSGAMKAYVRVTAGQESHVVMAVPVP